MSASCLFTYAASILTAFFFKSGASNDSSSKTFSMMVCRRRAPIFSVCSFTVVANLAMAWTASSVMLSLMPSVSSSAMYCLLGAFHCGSRHLIHVQQLAFFFLDQIFERVGHRHLAFLFLLAEHPAQHFLKVDVHLFDALIGNDFKRRHHLFANFNVHHALVQFALPQLCAHSFPGALVLLALRRRVAFPGSRGRWRCRRQQHVQDALFGSLLGALRNFIQ